MPKKAPKSNERRAISDDVHAMDKLINWSVLFPRNGRPDLRKNQSAYTRRKLLEVRAQIAEHGALRALVGKPSSFRPMIKSKLRDDAQRDLNVQPIFKGIFEPDPSSTVKVTRDRSGRVMISTTTRGGLLIKKIASSFNPLLIKSPEHLREVMGMLSPPPSMHPNKVALKNSDNLMLTKTITLKDEVITEAAQLWAKYAADADAGKTRKRQKGKYTVVDKVNHPNKWLDGLWWMSFDITK